MRDCSYHERIKEEKRTAVIHAAMELFLAQGYERTSLQQIGKRADVSTATLFKRFSTKAALFEAMVEEFWAVPPPCPDNALSEKSRRRPAKNGRELRAPDARSKHAGNLSPDYLRGHAISFSRPNSL
jgi:AcrR family transcriptional regulator